MFQDDYIWQILENRQVGPSRHAKPEMALLCLLLEVRAQMRALNEQLARINAELSRIDARLCRMEGAAMAPRAPAAAAPPAVFCVAARVRPMLLLDLPLELLGAIATQLAEDDELATSLTGRKLREAVKASERRAAGGRLSTSIDSLISPQHRLEWAVSCGLPLSQKLLSSTTCAGHLEQVSWLRLHGCPWQPLSLQRNPYSSAAARRGDLAMLRYLHADGCLFSTDEMSADASENGHLAVLEWARANGSRFGRSVCAGAAMGGHLTVLQWLRANDCPWALGTCSIAAQHGHLPILQWARANGCPWDAQRCRGAADNGDIPMLEWLNANGCPWDELTCSHAAMHGHLAVLQWLRVNGCPWDGRTCVIAAHKGHEAVLHWARANGCPETWERPDDDMM
jgi:hypothetical protein